MMPSDEAEASPKIRKPCINICTCMSWHTYALFVFKDKVTFFKVRTLCCVIFIYEYDSAITHNNVLIGQGLTMTLISEISMYVYIS